MRYILSWLLLLSPVLGLAQNSSSNMAKSSDVIRWQEGASNSDSIMSDGQEVKVISSDSVTVSVTLIERKNWIPHALVMVENKKTERFLVDPGNWTLNVVGPKPIVLRSREPEALARSLENRGEWAAAIGTATASMATTQSTATIRNSDGTTSTATITGPDKAAQQRAATNAREQRVTLASVAEYVRTSSLRPNTLFPKQSISGIVWFEAKKYKQVVLTIIVDGTTYEFPFEKKK